MTPIELAILRPGFNERPTIDAAIADEVTAELPLAHVRWSWSTTDRWTVPESCSNRAPGPMECDSSDTGKTRGRELRYEPRRRQASGEFVAILDADLEYSAADLAAVLRPLASGEGSVVFGTRAWTSQASFSFWYVIGNKAGTS